MSNIGLLEMMQLTLAILEESLGNRLHQTMVTLED